MNLFSLVRKTTANDWKKLKAVLQTEQPFVELNHKN